MAYNLVDGVINVPFMVLIIESNQYIILGGSRGKVCKTALCTIPMTSCGLKTFQIK